MHEFKCTNYTNLSEPAWLLIEFNRTNYANWDELMLIHSLLKLKYSCGLRWYLQGFYVVYVFIC